MPYMPNQYIMLHKFSISTLAYNIFQLIDFQDQINTLSHETINWNSNSLYASKYNDYTNGAKT